MTLGEKILNMRKARSWSQEELAELIGVTRQAVSRWESDSAKPDADKIIALCDLFGVSADYLLRDKYMGEPGKGGGEIPQVSELTLFIRRLTLKQWACIAAMLGGGLTLLILHILHIMAGSYGFARFLDQNPFGTAWLLAWCGIIGGAVCLFLWPFVKWIYRETVQES